jgi:hypothetical protein
MNRCCARVKVFVAVAASAMLMSAMVRPAAADDNNANTVNWKTIVGIVQPGNIVGSFPVAPNPASCPVPPATPVGVGCINGAGQPWTALGGKAKVSLANGNLEFQVTGLVLAGGNSIGTVPATLTTVKGTLICIVGTPTTNVIIDTVFVPLSSTGDAQFSGSVGPIPTSCTSSNIAFLIRISANRWIANGSVRALGEGSGD